MNSRQRLSIVISPPGREGSLEIGVSVRALKILGAALVLAVLVGLVGMGQVGALYRKAILYGRIADENEQLRRQHEELAWLQAEIDSLKASERRMRALTVGPIPGSLDEAVAAVGGDSVYRALLRAEMEETSPPGLRWPWSGPLSRRFEAGVHAGIDIAGPVGSPVVAAAAGRVDFAGWDETLGNMVVLDHGEGLRTVYGHNDRLLVETGELVQAGQEVALLGDTGKSSGPHVHFEVRRREIPLPPESFLPPRGGIATPSLSGRPVPGDSPAGHGGGMD